MLVLSRKLNEKIVINDDIVLTVLRISGEKVRIGIQAPREVSVHRAEVAERIRWNEEQAKQAGAQPVTPSPADELPRSALLRSVRRRP